jgi:hypothetical protein
MNKKRILFVMLAGLLALGLVFTACKSDPAPDPTDAIIQGLGTADVPIDLAAIRKTGMDTSGLAAVQSGDYVVIWGAFDGNWTHVTDAISEQNWTANLEDGSVTSPKSKYTIDKNTAVEILNYCVKNTPFLVGGGEKGTYTYLVKQYKDPTYKEGLPASLSNDSAMGDKQDQTPIAGVFENGQGDITVFYIHKVK